MSRMGVAFFAALFLLVVLRFGPQSEAWPKQPEREALKGDAAQRLGELREVASSWLELPVPEAGAERSPAELESDAPKPAPVERVTPIPEIAEGAASEWQATEVPASREGEASAEPLGSFSSNGLDESAEIVERLLGIYTRLGPQR